MSPLLLSIAAFVAVAALVFAISYVMSDLSSTKAEDRLQTLTGHNRGDDAARSITKDQLLREGMSGLSGWFSKIGGRLENVQLIFEQADCPLRSETFLFLIAGFVCAGVGVAAVSQTPLPLYPVFGIAFGALPVMWLLWRRSRRFKKFAKQLPDALELIGRALRSGHSLASGLHVVVDEMPDPIATEFNNAYEEQNLGRPIEVALKGMLRRMPNLDLKFFVTAVAIQRQSGGDLAEILDKIGYIIRERFKIMGQVQALTGEGRISGVVLMALPIALFFAVYHLNPQYVMMLFTEELGRKMIAVAAFLQVLGAVCIKKIIAIKV